MTKSFSPEFDNSKNDLFWRSAPVVLIRGSRGDNGTVAETERRVGLQAFCPRRRSQTSSKQPLVWRRHIRVWLLIRRKNKTRFEDAEMTSLGSSSVTQRDF